MVLTELTNVRHRIINPLIKPDSQRDAVRLNTTGGATVNEGWNHCKNTSCTMALNWVGQNFPSGHELATMGETQYNALLNGFGLLKNHKIQDWEPHIAGINQLLQDGKIPLRANFVNFRRNYNQVIYSLLSGRPVILGTMITKDGHIVLLVGMTEGGSFIIIDPYGDPRTNYQVKTADYYVISQNQFDSWVNGICNCIFFTEI